MSARFDFQLYLKCAKPLVLALPSIEDRSLASAWIKRLLDDDSVSEELKFEYLKLLLFFLQRRTLDGFFVRHPSNYDFLPVLPNNQNLFEAIKPKDRRSERTKPYDWDVSSDLCAYVAYQASDNLVHGYYAVSNEPITTWGRFHARPNRNNESTQEATTTKEQKPKHHDIDFDDDRIPPSWGSNLILPTYK